MKKKLLKDTYLKLLGIKRLLKIMKLTIFLVFMSLLQISATTYSQNTKLNLSLKKATLRQIFEEIEKQSEFKFLFLDNIIDSKQQVTIKTKATIDEILKELFEDGEIEYQILENNLVVISAATVQQAKTITGLVIDDSGQELPGVSVIVEGTTTGTVTGIDGNYTLDVPDDATSLIFSFIGMKSVVEPINGRTSINVTLEAETFSLEEVVTVGYGVQRKATLTGAIGVVTSEKLTQRPAANTTELLQGQVAGLVTRQESGLPGADGTTIRIRNFGNPLMIIDGVEGDLAQVDPNDIESISVLKDASASIYGARAGNGVIIVTTKRGADKPSRITYHGSVSFAQPTFLPDHAGAPEWAEMLYESGLNPDEYSPNHVSYNPDTKTLTNTMDGSNYEGYNWDDAMYRNWTPQQQHNISASGGNKKIKYFISAGFTDQESNFQSGDYNFKRYNIRSNIDAKITDNLSVSVDFAYRSTQLDRANFSLTSVYTALQTANPTYPFINEEDPSKATFSGFLQRSPYYQLKKEFSGFEDNRQNVIQGALELKYSFPMIKGLTAKARLNYEEEFSWDKRVSKPFDIWEYDPIAAQSGEDPWIRRGTQNSNNMSVYSGRGTQLLPLVSLEYIRSFGDHNLKGMIAGESRTYKGMNVGAYRKNILSYEAPYLRYASQEGKDNTEGTSQNARTSVIGRVNYEYQGKYLLEFTMRADASAEYPPEGRWGYFPSISAGWRISEESFIRDNFSAVNNLKLRASYGILGNDAVSSFDYLSGYNITSDYFIFGSTPVPVISSAGLANPNISWETMKISNIGLDGTFWQGKLGFEIDAFYRLREDILAAPTEQVPSTFGASLPLTNLNKRDNRGFEITLTHQNKIGDVSYHVSPMFSWSRGKWVERDEEMIKITDDMDEGTKEYYRLWNDRNVTEGQWDDRQWGYVFDGFFMNQQEIDDSQIDQDQAGNQTLIVGDIIYKDLNGDDYIDWRDEKVIGASGLPNIMYSLDVGAEYKGLSVNMLWQGAADYVVRFSNSAAVPFANGSIPLTVHYENRAIVGQDANGMDYITNPDDCELPPVTQNGSTRHSTKGSDFWIYDANFLRLKNINISYTLPRKVIKKAGIRNCTFYVSGTNMFTISNLGIWKKSFDPENPQANNYNYPPVKTMTFGVRLTL